MRLLRSKRARRAFPTLLAGAMSLAALTTLATTRTAEAMSTTPACAPPTLQQCDDPAYISSTCGQQSSATCNTLIVNAYTDQYNASGAAKLEFLPAHAPVTPNLRSGRWAAYDPTHLTLIASADPSYGGDQVVMTMSPTAGHLGDIGGVALPFEGDGTAVTSCREYVFKRYWDYTMFQRAATACGRDSRCVYDEAMNGAHAITKPTLYERNGSAPLDQKIPVFVGRKSKNLFFDTPVNTWSKDAAKLARFNAILARQTASANFYRIGTGEKWIPMGLSGEIFADEWAFHRSLHDRNVNVSDAQLQAYAERKAKLADLNATHDALLACSVSRNIGCDQTNPFYMDQVKANDEAIFQMVSDEWDLGDDGCMSNANYACDWSPDDFRKELTHLFGKEMQAAYMDCTQLGGSTRFVPANVPSDAWVNIDGAWYAQPTGDVPAYKAWSDARKAQLLKQFAALPKYPEADGSPVLGHIGSKMSGNNAIGDKSLFQAGYDYSIDWDVRKAVQKSDTDKQACAYAGGFNALFHADATLLTVNVAQAMGLHASNDGIPHIASSETSVIADARVAGGVPRVSSHTTILDNDVYTAAKDAYVATWTAPLNERTAETSHFQQTVVIVVVPVTFEAWGQFSYGATASLSTKATIDCVNAPQFGVNLELKPYVHADAVGTIAVGVPGFEVGVKGQIALVHVDMPITGGMNVAENNPTERKPVLRFTTRGDVELSELSGSVSAFAEAFFLTYEKELFQWNGLHQSLNMWKTGSDVELAAYRLVDACPITNMSCGK